MNKERTIQNDTQPSSHDNTEAVFEFRDPDIDVEAIMTQIRENVARRRAEGAYQEDVEVIADEVFADVMSMPTAGLGVGLNTQGIDATLAELNMRWIIREVPFSSSVPVVGKLVVALRNLWNWVSTKWYVRALVQQQVEFNALVAQAFNEMLLENQSRIEDVEKLQKTVKRQQEEIETLRATVARLSDDDPK